MKKGKKGKKKKVIIILLIILMIPICGLAYGYYLLGRLSSGDISAKQVDINEPVNILLLGVDAGDYVNKTSNNPKRSDTMMVIRYNPKEDKIYMLSIPRDTKTVIDGHIEKINSAHRMGGVPLAIKTVENILGITINYYATIDYAGFRQCIDAIGGIDIKIPFDMDYDAYGISIHFKEGETVHMDGKKAEEFVRWRKNNDGGGYARGDLGRISTQQDFLMKIIQKMKTPTGIIRVPSLLNTVTKYVKTNMDSKTMLKYMLRLRNINLSTIDRRLLAGEPKYIKNVSFFIWNKAENEEYLRNFRDELNVSSTVEEDRGNIKVSILNSTGINGLASKYKTELQNMGYEVVEIGNYSTQLENTIIKDYSLKGYGDQLNSDLKMGEVEQEKDNNTKCNIVVILGMDSVK